MKEGVEAEEVRGRLKRCRKRVQL
jgi:hypothetical protein